MFSDCRYKPHVHNVQLYCTKNNKEDRTDDIAVNRLIVRRGQPFQLTFHAEQAFRPRQDFFQFVEQTEQFLLINIPFANYGPKMLVNDSIKVLEMARNSYDPNEIYIAEKDFVPQRLTLTLKAPGTAVQFSEIVAEVVFENPLPKTLKNCSITLMGSGLLQQPEICRAALIGPRDRMKVSVRFQPCCAGLKKLVADFQCSAFTKISASCNIDVKPALADNVAQVMMNGYLI
ncbi:hypothetical protein MHYP_G00217760 [Metynnis hypsauchen]